MAAWSPDGSTIAFSTDRFSSNLANLQAGARPETIEASAAALQQAAAAVQVAQANYDKVAGNPDVGAFVERCDDQVLRRGEAMEDELLGFEVAGVRRWIRYSVIPVVEFGDEHPTGAVASFRDVTAEHELQAALTASEAQFRTLTDTAPIGIATPAR